MQQQQRHLLTMPMSPMSTVSQAMQSTTLGGQRSTQSAARNAPQATTTDTSPFTSQSGGQGTLFHPPPPPVTQADRDTLKISLAAYPMQPNTQASNAVWQNQLREWKLKHRKNTEVMAITGFQLRPGGAAPGSGECYGCGLVGHRRNSPQCVSGQSTLVNVHSAQSVAASFTSCPPLKSTSSVMWMTNSIGSTINHLNIRQAREMGKGHLHR